MTLINLCVGLRARPTTKIAKCRSASSDLSNMPSQATTSLSATTPCFAVPHNKLKSIFLGMAAGIFTVFEVAKVRGSLLDCVGAHLYPWRTARHRRSRLCAARRSDLRDLPEIPRDGCDSASSRITRQLPLDYWHNLSAIAWSQMPSSIGLRTRPQSCSPGRLDANRQAISRNDH